MEAVYTIRYQLIKTMHSRKSQKNANAQSGWQACVCVSHPKLSLQIQLLYHKQMLQKKRKDKKEVNKS